MTAFALVVGLLMAGCGNPPAAPSATKTAAAEDNERLAKREAARLATLARVPPASIEVDAPANGLESVPHVLMYGGQAIVTRYWTVATPYAQVLAWLKVHPPEGLSLFNSFTGGPQAGYGYREPATSAWDTAQLQLVTSPINAQTSGIRADATVIWLDPAPERDTRTGLRMRITVAGGCPASDADVVGVEAVRSDLSDQLVPPGEPSGGLICRYDGMNGDRYALASSKRLDTSGAIRLAGALRAVRLSRRSGTTVRSCTPIDGSADVLVLSYPGQPDAPVWVSVGGCGRVSNGVIILDIGDLGATLNALQQGKPRQ